jgi:RHS repeat-associated protein
VKIKKGWGKVVRTGVPAGGLGRETAVGVALALLLGAVSVPSASAAAHRPPYRPAPLPKMRSVPGHVQAAARPSADPAARRALHGNPRRSELPAAGAMTVNVPLAPAHRSGLPTGNPASAGVSVRAGGLQVRVAALAQARTGLAQAAGSPAPVSRVRIEVLGQRQARAARVRGVLLRVVRAEGARVPGRLMLSVGYAAFRNAFGADWNSRLRIASVPACAQSPREVPGCRAVPLRTSNDVAHGVVTAVVTAAPDPAAQAGVPVAGAGAALWLRMATHTSFPAAATAAPAPAATVSATTGTVSLTSGSSGPAGDFSATSLRPSATWGESGSTGSFTWSYPMQVPPAAGGLAPKVQLSYSSQSMDGRTAASNNQPSWIGEGFDFWPGFIERSYRPCADDMGGTANNTVKTGDLCWAGDNATLSLNGKAVELIRDDATGAWHPRADDGSRIEHFTGGPNGDNDGEYWRVTTPDGTQYWFGRNRLPGWAAGNPETNSAWTVPVFGNNTGDPCHQTTFDASWCQQAWRWNLDYVVDPHGNSMSFWYTPETNLYGRDNDGTKVSSYVRGGTLARIDYGTSTGAEFGTVPDRVVFTAADRCVPGSTCDQAHPASWPDVPWDQACSGAPCTNVLTPTFWTTKRLASVTTQVWDASSSGYRNVDSWDLVQSFPTPGDGTRAGLWLASVTHTGLAGGSAADPPVTFTGIQLNNRVDSTDFAPPMNWWRVAAIDTETGGQIGVRYSDPDCVAGSRMPSSPDSNTLRCFPVYWVPQGYTQPVLDWFHKYVVTAVAEADLTGGSPRVITTYNYAGAPAWHYDDLSVVAPSRKTWGEWRGYQKVQVFHGDPGEQTEADTLYFRGMDGDHLSSGGTRSVTLTDSQGGTWTDSDSLAGMAREVITYKGPGGPVVADTINDPYMSAPTSSHNAGGVTVTARYTGTATTKVLTALDGGRGYRTTQTQNSFDAYGMIATTNDLGDVSTPADDRCTRYTYARNTTAWLISYASETETDALSCDKTPASAGDVISDTRTFFDGQDFGAAPVKGDVTRTDQLSAWPATGRVYITMSRASYDSLGRATDNYDALGNHTTTAYTPATSGPLTQVVTTNPLGQATTQALDPAWGTPVSTVDANNKTTSLAYDPLGRLTGVWLPGRVEGSTTPNISYSYLVRANGAVAVTTSKLAPGGNYVTSEQLYDGLLRPRQTQAPAPGGGRIITDMFYDTAGRVVKTFGKYYNSSAPSTALFTASDFTLIPEQHATVYDGAGRVTSSIYQPGGLEQWRTVTAYGGDHVDVTPPAGGTPTSTYTDSRGNTVELRQYHGSSLSGAYDATKYTYNPSGQLASVTDQAGNSWRYAYDLLGRQTSATDPDQGTTTSTYDNAGHLTSITDSRGQTLAYTYDALGRKTGVYQDSPSGTQLAGWTYDTLAKGQLASSTSYAGGNPYTIAVRGYNNYYEPTGSTITIPTAEGALAGSYVFRVTYNPDGSPASQSFPATGDLPAETVRTAYTPDLGLPSELTTNLAENGQPDTVGTASYITGTDYSAIGQLLRYTMGATTASGPSVWQTYAYQTGTGRLAGTEADREAQTPNTLSKTAYTYDPTGNVTSITDAPPGQQGDTQCFSYDYLRRLTQAWTPGTGDCSTSPTGPALGGPAPYWQNWTYDTAGDRLTQTDHATSAGDVTTTYRYPQPGSPQPHAVQQTTNSSGTVTGQYRYDALGDTTSRPGPNGTQTLTWNPQGDLASVSGTAGETSYTYDADRNVLLRHDPGGATLYLPGTELRLSAATGQLTATRYYLYAGHPVAMRTAAGTTWLLSDPQNTTTITVTADTQASAMRRLTPFGALRGKAPAWPTDKGFVGGADQPTGLTLLGARQYDPATGRFISVDPQFDPTDPQQMNGYAYADNTPVTQTDPSGLRAACDDPAQNCGDPTSGAAQAPQGPTYGQSYSPDGSGYSLTDGSSYSSGNPESGIKTPPKPKANTPPVLKQVLDGVNFGRRILSNVGPLLDHLQKLTFFIAVSEAAQRLKQSELLTADQKVADRLLMHYARGLMPYERFLTRTPTGRALVTAAKVFDKVDIPLALGITWADYYLSGDSPGTAVAKTTVIATTLFIGVGIGFGLGDVPGAVVGGLGFPLLASYQIDADPEPFQAIGKVIDWVFFPSWHR